MKRALVLNAAMAWTPYQIGALRHLIIDQQLRFELCAGTGMGAITASMVACDEFLAWEQFWQQFRLRRLASLNWRTPWAGLLSSAPLRRFLAQHISEERLRQQGVTLLIGLMNLQTGKEQIFSYPGCDLPLLDVLLAAVATPGLFPPLPYKNTGTNSEQQIAEGTFINSFLLPAVLHSPVEEIIALAVALPRGDQARRRYKTWPTVFERALAMNLAHDVWDALDRGYKATAAAQAFIHVSQHLPQRLAQSISDPVLQERVLTAVKDIYRNSHYPLQRSIAIRSLTPSADLAYPLWRFRSRELAAARALGYKDAVDMLEKGQVVL